MKDESLDIAGYSNEADPVPLFAHECAGLYEDDEIPGADEEDSSSYNGHFFKDDKEDYNDPTLEKFPSTRDGIISTVRKVESGLNVDQVSVERVPLSPIVPGRSSPTTEARSESAASDASSTSRDPLHLPVPLSVSFSDDRSVSATSLHSIAEDAEGVDEEDISEEDDTDADDVLDQSKAIGKTTEESKAAEIAPFAEQAQTAEEVIEAVHEVEGEQRNEVATGGKDLPSLADIPIANIASIVELPPALEDSVSPTELPTAVQDIASVIEQTDVYDEAHLADAEVETGERADEIAKETEREVSLPVLKPILEPLVMVPSPLVKPSTGLLSPLSDDDEAVVVKSARGDDDAKSGYLTPQRAATPQPEEPGSPREPAPNNADPFPKYDVESDPPKSDTVVTHSLPRSPSIVVSKPEETFAEEELLSAASLGGSSSHEAEPVKQSEVSKDEGVSSRDIDNAEGPADVKASKGTEDDESGEASKDGETSGGSTAPSAANGSQSTATSSATEGSQPGALKQRSLGRPDPTERSTTPKSFTNPHREAAKDGNWILSFLRLIFIDFFGGIGRKLYRGDRKT